MRESWGRAAEFETILRAKPTCQLLLYQYMNGSGKNIIIPLFAEDLAIEQLFLLVIVVAVTQQSIRTFANIGHLQNAYVKLPKSSPARVSVSWLLPADGNCSPRLQNRCQFAIAMRFSGMNAA